MVSVNVRWNKKNFENVEIDTSLPPTVFKHQLWTLTGVPPDKQSVMIKGRLKDEDDLSKLGIKQGQSIMLIGTSETDHLTTPTEAPVFIEDLSKEELRIMMKEKKIAPLPLGLKNLGNTCYLAAVLQLIRPVEKLNQALGSYSSTEQSLRSNVVYALNDLFNTWNCSVSAPYPKELVRSVRSCFPQLASQRSGGMWMQQDAEECLNLLLNLLNEQLAGIVRKEIGFELQVTLKCDETNETETSTDKLLKVSCFTGTQTQPVNHVFEGIKLALEEVLEKHSDVLGKTTSYSKCCRIASLPEFLVVHFVRFEWKAAHSLARTEAGRAKVCKKISFPRDLDLMQFLSDELKTQITPARDALTAKKGTEEKEDTTSEHTGKPTGHYDLCSVVTHQGRTADDGHYVAWRRKEEIGEMWLKFDDDKVSEVEWKNIDLSGGRSDYHIAVLALYKKKIL